MIPSLNQGCGRIGEVDLRTLDRHGPTAIRSHSSVVMSRLFQQRAVRKAAGAKRKSMHSNAGRPIQILRGDGARSEGATMI